MLTTKNAHQRMIEVITSRNWDEGRQLLHSEYTYTGADGRGATGPEAGIQVAQTYTSAFPDLQIEIEHLHALEDVAVAEFRVTGTHRGELNGIAPTGRTVSLPVANILELRDGKIYREREYFDSYAMLEQLGVVPGASQ